MKKTSIITPVLLAVLMFSGCMISSDFWDEEELVTIEEESAGDASNEEHSEESQELIIADDDSVTATFEKIYDATSLGIEDVFYVDINVKNKSDKEIFVVLDKASVNDEMLPMVSSGFPLIVKADKSGRNAFIFSFIPLSIDRVEEVEKIEFDLVIFDNETLDEMDRISSIELDF